jgi:ribosomal protein S27E
MANSPDDEISFQIRNIIVQEFSRAMASLRHPVLDMAANTGEVGKLVAQAIDPTIHAYGLTLPELYIENISLPPAVEKALDERTSRGIAGNLDDHMKWKAAEAMTTQGSGAGEAMGMGLGAAMGMQMAGHDAAAGPWGAASPRPLPAAARRRPRRSSMSGTSPRTARPRARFPRPRWGGWPAEGALTRETYVWTQGQDGWMKAEDVAELAQLFTVLPPPPRRASERDCAFFLAEILKMAETETDTLRPNEEHRFPCEACGADLRFAPGQTELVCDHCGAAQAIEGMDAPPGAIAEIDYHSALAGLPEAEIEETRVSTCPNCAAQVEFDPAVHAADCPFCATPVVTDTGTHRHIKPKGVLAFQLDEEAAREAMTRWLGRLWFAPNGLQQYARKGRRMAGIYVPYWTYDADTKSSYRGQRGDAYYVTQTVMRDGKPQQVQVQKIRWSSKRGRVARVFDDVLVLASRSLPKTMTDALEPWDLSRLVPYTPALLAGFRAEGYTVELPEGLQEARAYMDRVIERDVRFAIGGDRQRIEAIDTKVSAVTFKHVLLPVWLAAYKYRGKTYRFVVNGQTGQVQGERPWSAWKIAFAVVLGLLVAAIIGAVLAANG